MMMTRANKAAKKRLLLHSAAAALDPTNFLTSKHDNWAAVAFDQMCFPADMTPY